MVEFTETHTKEARKDIHNSCATRQLRDKKCIRIEEQPAAGRLTTSSSEVRLKQPLLRTSLIRVTHTVSVVVLQQQRQSMTVRTFQAQNFSLCRSLWSFQFSRTYF